MRAFVGSERGGAASAATAESALPGVYAPRKLSKAFVHIC